MKTLRITSFAAFTLLVFCADARALSFTFRQIGFEQGATVSGSFSGLDSNSNGSISSFEGEVNGFLMSFSGNSLVPAFSLNFANLQNLVYVLGAPALGDNFFEGIEAFDGTFQYVTGQGPLGFDGGLVSTPTQISITPLAAQVASVPDGGSTAFCLTLGLLGCVAVRKWSLDVVAA